MPAISSKREKWKCSTGEFCFRAGIKPHCHILQKLLRFALLTEHGSLFPAPNGYTTEPSNECRSDHVKINRQLIDTGEEGIHLLKGLDDEH
ncbi:hypothetical protein ACFX2B_040221 [Malus domestica]